MLFRLSDQNVLDYLKSQHIYESSDPEQSEIQLKSGKNFNLLVRAENKSAFLVKQERYDSQGATQGEFWNEWRLQEFLQRFPELKGLKALITAPLHFDPDASIIIFEYLEDYFDLADFYDKEQCFLPEIATLLGRSLATLHQATYRGSYYEAALTELSDGELTSQIPSILYGLERISPNVFAKVRQDSLDFFRLYQRYPSLGDAIAQLKADWHPCCLTHADLRFSNVLVHQNWKKQPQVRLIDWEKFMWGDLALDLGTLIAGYLRRWLESLVVHPALDIATMLHLARLPIAQLQPSMIALVDAYLEQFSELLFAQPDFLQRVLKFAGVTLIEKILIKLECHDAFDNIDTCMLQVAKSLLCSPDQASLTVFNAAHLTRKASCA